MTLKHELVGLQLSKTEYEEADGGSHTLDGQTAGDIIYAADGSILRRLGIGSNDDVLQVKSGLPSYRSLAQLTVDQIEAILSQGEIRHIPLTGWNESVTGTGVIQQRVTELDVRTESTASSTAFAREGSTPAPGWSEGQVRQKIDWSKIIIVDCMMTIFTVSTNGEVQFTFGKNGTSLGDLSDHGIGLKITNGMLLNAVAHNGSILTTTSSGITLVNAIPTRIRLVSDGSGNVKIYTSNVLRATNTGGPTSLGTSGKCQLSLEAKNGADSSNNIAVLHGLRVYVAQ